jgi:hypothetical protein
LLLNISSVSAVPSKTILPDHRTPVRVLDFLAQAISFHIIVRYRKNSGAKEERLNKLTIAVEKKDLITRKDAVSTDSSRFIHVYGNQETTLCLDK